MLLLAAAVLPALLGTQPAPPGCQAVPAPRVEVRANVARATSSPWIEANAWRFLRHPDRVFCIEAPGPLSAVAAAEAFAYQVTAFVKTAAEGVERFERMRAFLAALPPVQLPPLANIGLVDDGSAQAGELMNLLSRRNLLYRVVARNDTPMPVMVVKAEPGDPNRQAYEIRQRVGDDKRLLRLYGSEVVIGRLAGDGSHARVQLVNYAQRPVNGLRVRVLGPYRQAEAKLFNAPDNALLDVTSDGTAVEFTIPHLNEYASIDLSR